MCLTFRLRLQAIAMTTPLLFAAVLSSGAEARGGGFGGAGHAHGVGSIGVYGTRHPGAIARFGNGRGFSGRLGGNTTGGYYPSAPFGPFGSSGYGGAPAGYGGPNVRIETPSRITIIRRGPAFGEPGYQSHPVIHRIVPVASPRTGVRRFKVESTTF